MRTQSKKMVEKFDVDIFGDISTTIIVFYSFMSLYVSLISENAGVRQKTAVYDQDVFFLLGTSVPTQT